MLPDAVARATAGYLRAADRVLPGRVVGCYVFGSVALDAYRDGSSDIDLLAVLDDAPVSTSDVRRLRLLHVSQVPRLVVRLVTGRGLSATCNVSFVRRRDLTSPVTTINPVGSHTGHEFHVARAFDVNPVTWHVLANRGIPVRGPATEKLGLDPEPEALRYWNVDNLRGYWSDLATAVATRPRPLSRSRLSWCVSGPLRLHATIATGQILSKEAATRYGADVFDEQWADLIGVTLAELRGEPRRPLPPAHTARTARFMRTVISDAIAIADAPVTRIDPSDERDRGHRTGE